MPAILSENGFMDNKREALLMINKDFQKEVAVDHAKGICDYLGVKYVPEVKTIYRLRVGEYVSSDEANKARTRLKSLGYESTVVADKI
jgi:N-acetylmuramoyl-L-alanine amidase